MLSKHCSCDSRTWAHRTVCSSYFQNLVSMNRNLIFNRKVKNVMFSNYLTMLISTTWKLFEGKLIVSKVFYVLLSRFPSIRSATLNLIYKLVWMFWCTTESLGCRFKTVALLDALSKPFPRCWVNAIMIQLFCKTKRVNKFYHICLIQKKV